MHYKSIYSLSVFFALDWVQYCAKGSLVKDLPLLPNMQRMRNFKYDAQLFVHPCSSLNGTFEAEKMTKFLAASDQKQLERKNATI